MMIIALPVEVDYDGEDDANPVAGCLRHHIRQPAVGPAEPLHLKPWNLLEYKNFVCSRMIPKYF